MIQIVSQPLVFREVATITGISVILSVSILGIHFLFVLIRTRRSIRLSEKTIDNH